MTKHSTSRGRVRRSAAILTTALGAALLIAPAANAADPVITVRSAYIPSGGGSVNCNAGETAVGGGAAADVQSLMYVDQSEPTPNSGKPTGWKGSLSRRIDGTPGSGSVYAVCATAVDAVVRSAYIPSGGGSVNCNAGETAVGGGIAADVQSLMYVDQSEPTPNSGKPTGWKGSLSRRINGTPGSGSVYAVCATAVNAVVRSAYIPSGGGSVNCNAGETAVGGGIAADVQSLMYVDQTEPTPNNGRPTGWKGSLSRRINGTPGSGSVYAVCATPPPATTPPATTPPATTPPATTPPATTPPATTPPATTPPATTPVVTPPKPPVVVAPPPVAPPTTVAVKPQVVFFPSDMLQVRHEWLYFKRYSRVRKLKLVGMPAGGSLTIRCKGGGCPFGRKTLDFPQAVKSTSLASLFTGRRLKVGTTLELRIAAPNFVDKVVRFRVRPGRLPRVTVLCLHEGETTPSAC